MAPPARFIPYRCPACGWNGEIIEQELERRRDTATTMRSLGDFTCAFDERLLCKQCCPTPGPDETDLRVRSEWQEGYRIVITHERRPVRRVLWLSSVDLQDLESTLLGRRDAAYLGPARMKRGKSRAIEPALQAWWRALRSEVDGSEPDLGHELGMTPRSLEFGRLGAEPVSRSLHLLNPTDRPAVFQLTNNILASDPGPHANPRQFPYRVASTPAIEAARRSHDSFEVSPSDRLVLEVVAQPSARHEQVRWCELWVTPEGSAKEYLGQVHFVHKP